MSVSLATQNISRTHPHYIANKNATRKPLSFGTCPRSNNRDVEASSSMWGWNKRPIFQDKKQHPYRKTISTYTIVHKPAALKTQNTTRHKAIPPSPASFLARLRLSTGALFVRLALFFTFLALHSYKITPITLSFFPFCATCVQVHLCPVNSTRGVVSTKNVTTKNLKSDRTREFPRLGRRGGGEGVPP